MTDDIKEKVLHVFDLLDKKMINTRIARSVTAEIFETGKTAENIINNRPLKPCCESPAKKFFETYSDELIAKVFKEYPDILKAFEQNDINARERIIRASLRVCNDGDVACSMNDLIEAAKRYVNLFKEIENVKSQS